MSLEYTNLGDLHINNVGRDQNVYNFRNPKIVIVDRSTLHALSGEMQNIDIVSMDRETSDLRPSPEAAQTSGQLDEQMPILDNALLSIKEQYEQLKRSDINYGNMVFQNNGGATYRDRYGKRKRLYFVRKAHKAKVRGAISTVVDYSGPNGVTAFDRDLTFFGQDQFALARFALDYRTNMDANTIDNIPDIEKSYYNLDGYMLLSGTQSNPSRIEIIQLGSVICQRSGKLIGTIPCPPPRGLSMWSRNSFYTDFDHPEFVRGLNGSSDWARFSFDNYTVLSKDGKTGTLAISCQTHVAPEDSEELEDISQTWLSQAGYLHHEMSSKAPDSTNDFLFLSAITFKLESLDIETCKKHGLPVLKPSIKAVNWKPYEYAAIRCFQRMKGYNPGTQQHAEEQELPLLQLQACNEPDDLLAQKYEVVECEYETVDSDDLDHKSGQPGCLYFGI
ncbi:hypothetical protein K435DRAFT_807060 [Dendrothele bispora CBS 962.96]|uniref:Uncharacterized protein n=1 Tax=Dendrothele bispora (strain CBS 962.96) TaxID=1314807 RepID=A0A4S8L6D2_DENBC|nr:hypothetical protein K435DRAFT_807060 [Dendrothele bispora CBS 962.96]